MASSQYGFAPPPPPPPPAPLTEASNTHTGPPSPSSRTAQAIGALRRRVHPTPTLPTITTSLHSTPGASLLSLRSAVTPSTASTAPPLSVPFSPYVAPPPPLTATATVPPVTPSPMATRSAQTLVAPYNPSEWSRSSGAAPGAYVPYHQQSPPEPIRTTEITGMEAANMPSPPPPYSPSPTASPPHHMAAMPIGAPPSSIQTASQQSFRDITSPVSAVPASAHPMSANPLSAQPWSAITPQGSAAPWDQHRMTSVLHESPRQATPPSFQNFPPPPGRNPRDRSGSRQRADGRSLLSGLSSVLTSRSRTNEQAQQPNAIDALRMNTTDVLARAPNHHQQLNVVTSTLRQGSQDSDIISPPAARRAISTGGIGIPGPSRRDSDRTESPLVQPGWQPGMPLPPPPSGPPPSGNRSQSMGRASERSWSATSSRDSSIPAPAPLTRRPPQRGTTLDPVPPTPADWVDAAPDTAPQRQSSSGRLTVDTTVGASARPVTPLLQDESVSVSSSRATDSSSNQQSSSTGSATASAGSATGGLSRQPAKRAPSARGIRERRSESRAAKGRGQDARPDVEQEIDDLSAEINRSDAARPANLDLEAPPSRKWKASVVSAAGAENVKTSPAGELAASQQGKHRQVSSRSLTSSSQFTDTPPFSPVVDGGDQYIRRGSRGKASPALPPVALPTPPHRTSGDYFRPGSSVGSRQMPEASSASLTEDEQFTQGCLERHRAFIEQELAAKSDKERLELFADFMVRESRLRRDRYAAAFDGMAGEIFDLTRDMWRSYGSGRRSATPIATPATAHDVPKLSRHHTTSSSGSHANTPGVEDSPALDTPHSDFESPMSTPGQGRSAEDGVARNTFKPNLSPIPSMAMSTVPDEQDSRGRSQSRWWEQSIDGSTTSKGGRRIERSKRESKYMGVNLEQIAQQEHELPATPQTGGTPGPSSIMPQVYYRPDEYPPEKTGLHDQPQQQMTPKYPYWQQASAPTTPDPYKLDVSRLVTLPPPYPRHHPAVNNSHPDLASLRTTHRSLADMSEVADVKGLFATKLQSMKEQHREEATTRRDNLRSNIQAKVQSGQMSYADAAAAEQEFQTREPRKMRDALQAEFDAFQAHVMTPLHAMLSERITKANAAVDQLKDAIDSARKNHSSNAQEEGDERPELLEKLTLLKWLFEARDVVLREFFDTETQRNELYRSLVVDPYRAAGNEDKAVEAEQFFLQDEKDRRNNFEKENLSRTETLMNLIERNVTAGVEDLLGAFWDIAPGLLAVVQKIPSDPGRDQRELLIPPMEFDENPSYHEHPLQYLFTLLLHAEKSAYQFIESQTNLLCLLHEAKTAVMVGGSKAMESERVQAGEEEGRVKQEMEEVRRLEEERLTSDLRDKISTLEGQWREGLGDALGQCRERVEQYLERTGGWDESLRE